MRTENSIKNIITSMIASITTIIIGLISQKIFTNTLGIEYLGINGLFTNIISMLGIIELGVGSAICFSLYKPFIDNDQSKIKSLIQFYGSSYRLIATAVLLIGVFIMPFIGSIVGRTNITDDIFIIYILFLLDVVFSYLLSYKRSVLYADQKNFIINITQIIYIILVNILQIAILLSTQNYYLYLAIKIIMHVIQNIALMIIVNKKYPFLKSQKIKKIDKDTKDDIFKKIRALSLHKIAGFVIIGTDNILISIFIGINTVGLMSNYYLITSSIISIVGQIFNAITASIGNLLNVCSPMKAYDIYKKIRFANFWMSSVSSITLLVTLDSFITIWLGNKYLLPINVLIVISINLYLQLSRLAMISFKEAAGIFYQDRFVPIAESLINIIFSIIFLQWFGLAGVFMGTICSNLLLHLFSYPKYVYTQLFKRSYKDYYTEFTKYLILTLVAGAITFVISRTIVVDSMFVNFAINIALSVVIPSFIFYINYRKNDEFIYFKNIIIKIFTKVKIKKYMK